MKGELEQRLIFGMQSLGMVPWEANNLSTRDCNSRVCPGRAGRLVRQPVRGWHARLRKGDSRALKD